MQLKDQAAIVTGGASGLGAATARRLAAQGAKVAVCDLNAKLAESVAAEIKGLAVVCDVADAASAEAAVVAAAKAHGPARVLVNCAGIGVAKRVIGREGPMPLADFDRVINVNLIGSFNMLRLAAAEMSKLEPLATGERGVVISTASIAAYDGQIGQAAYSASKGGIVGDDAADRARTGAVRHPRADHRAGPVPDAAARRPAAGGPGQPRRRDPVPAPARPAPTSTPRWRCT